MQRYYFDLHDHEIERDKRGTELDDDRAARISAVRFAGEVLKNEPTLLDEEDLTICARDRDGTIIFSVDMSLTDHRKASGSGKP